MTPDEIEKELERICSCICCDHMTVISDALRAVHDAAIEKAATVVEDRKKAYRVDVAADIRALKMT